MRLPQTVLIEFAINDAYRPNGISLAESHANIEQMIDRIRARYPNARIILMTMNPVWNGFEAERPDLAGYYSQYATLAHDGKVVFLDNFSDWLTIFRQDPERFAAMVPDGVHPTLAAHRLVTVKKPPGPVGGRLLPNRIRRPLVAAPDRPQDRRTMIFVFRPWRRRRNASWRRCRGAEEMAEALLPVLTEAGPEIQICLAGLIQQQLIASYKAVRPRRKLPIDPLRANGQCLGIAETILADNGYFPKLARWVAVNVCFWLWEGDSTDVIDGQSVGSLIRVYAEGVRSGRRQDAVAPPTGRSPNWKIFLACRRRRGCRPPSGKFRKACCRFSRPAIFTGCAKLFTKTVSAEPRIPPGRRRR